MIRPIWMTTAACVASLWLGVAAAAPSPQQRCDGSRIAAWSKYQACVDGVIADDAKGKPLDHYAKFAKCRHKYFANWAKFQALTALAGSTCVGARFIDNGDQTVSDRLTGLVWEQKDEAGGVHDKDDGYALSVGTPYHDDGPAYTTFLATLNGAGFAGAHSWRLPTFAELQTLIADFACSGAGGDASCQCAGNCVDPAFPMTALSNYQSATIHTPFPIGAWLINFGTGQPGVGNNANGYFVRAVRGGF